MSAAGIPKHYRTRELADLLSITPARIRKAVAEGALAAVKVSATDFIFAEPDVQAWLESIRREAVVVELAPRRHARTSTTARRRA